MSSVMKNYSKTEIVMAHQRGFDEAKELAAQIVQRYMGFGPAAIETARRIREMKP